MSQALIVEGHSKKLTITIQSAHKVTSSAAGVTTIEIDADLGSPFTGLAVLDRDQERFRTPQFQNSWTIRIE